MTCTVTDCPRCREDPERDELERNAARYLWLRCGGSNDGGADFYNAFEKDGYGGSTLKYGDDLDAAIDAEIAKLTGEKQ